MMTRRERMLTAMAGGIPDRVPASPDTSYMIPARLTGKPFWEVFYYEDPPRWKAYNDCVRYFGFDGCSYHGNYDLPVHPDAEVKEEVILKTDDRIVVRNTFRCPAGELYEEVTYLHNQPPTVSKKYIDDFERQYDCIRYLLQGDIRNIRFDTYKQIQADMGDNGVVALCMRLPALFTRIREPVESAIYDYYDYHDQLMELVELWTDQLVKIAQVIIDQKVNPDFMFFPNSGMLTLQSFDIMKEISFPALKKLTKMFKEAGIITSLHCCGKEKDLVELAAKETDLNCIEPLEIPPMGDCVLKELKQKFGNKLALKGNLHTTEVMLNMDADGVERAARQCLEDAMEGGGYILSSGDQCGRDTPDENIFRLVEVCEKYGRYT